MSSITHTCDCKEALCFAGEPSHPGGAQVALVVNAFDRNLEKVLAPGFFRELERQNRRRFTERILLINNVEDPVSARLRAQRLIDDGEVTAVHFVANHIDDVLIALGMSEERFGRVLHFTDYTFVAAFVTTSSYMLYWDADVSLERPVDWVGPSVELLDTDPAVFSATARPVWWDPRKELTVSARPGFALGYGFSDQMFLVRTGDLRQPIYSERCPASVRYPVSHVSAIFEQRLDSYMRNHSLYRAVYLGSLFLHEGKGWYWPTTVSETVRFVRNRCTSRILKTWPLGSNPAWKI